VIIFTCFKPFTISRLVPESFRWYIANDHPEKAKAILKAVANANHREAHINNIDAYLVKPKDVNTKRYTFIDLLKHRSLMKIMILSSLNW